MSNKRLITVIVPVYKVEDYLDRCIESIVEQTYKDLEIILVDDGSPDRCPQICDEWQKKDKRIRVIHKENGGLSDARNVAIKEAKGIYYLLVDSDDFIVKDAVERLEAYASDEDVIVAEAKIYEPDGIVDRVHTNIKENYVYSGSEYSIEAISKGEWFAAACYNMYRTEFIKKNELFFKTGILHEDIEYVPRLFLMAEKVKYLHYEFYRYMIRGDSICSIKSSKHLNDLFSTYSYWKILNDTIEDDKLFKSYSGALSKYFISTCRQYRVSKRVYPEGIDAKYLLTHSLNDKELLKTIVFVLFRSLYVRL